MKHFKSRIPLQLSLYAFGILTCSQTTSVFANDELPSRKPGLWESKVSMTSLGGEQTTKECVSAETDKAMMLKSPSGPNGSQCKNSVKKNGNAWTIEVSCARDGISMNSTNTLSGDFQSSYKGSGVVKFKMKSDKAPKINIPDQSITIDATYKGACPKDMKPGDIVAPGLPGMGDKKFNINDSK